MPKRQVHCHRLAFTALPALVLAAVLAMLPGQALAQAQEGFIGEIRIFAGSYEPQNWRFCQGQVLNIEENVELFSVIGCVYGGNCHTTFALPDLRGRAAVGAGQGSGLTSRDLGQKFGSEQATLNDRNKGQQLTVTQTPTGHTGESLDITPPSLGVNYIICVQGDYPTRWD